MEFLEFLRLHSSVVVDVRLDVFDRLLFVSFLGLQTTLVDSARVDNEKKIDESA